MIWIVGALVALDVVLHVAALAMLTHGRWRFRVREIHTDVIYLGPGDA